MNSKTAARSILGKLSITLALLMISCLALGQSNKKPESAPAAPSASKRAPAAQRPAPPANRGPAQNSAQGRPNNASNTTHGPNAAHGAPAGSNGAGGANSARGMNNARGPNGAAGANAAHGANNARGAKAAGGANADRGMKWPADHNSGNQDPLGSQREGELQRRSRPHHPGAQHEN
ncbi:MAG: hypothetical protein AUH01_05805 [Acidobacteria bacterium 13_2_20CM_56_17]|nr:MAG: hypothetical protein AUH01_05805 [Acidobacteria bacterium 13_2_20CM_56_17]